MSDDKTPDAGSEKESSDNAANDTPEATLPEKPSNRKNVVLGVGAAVIVAILAVVLIVVNSGGDSSAEAKKVRIGVTDASSEYWGPFKELAKAEGIEIETVNFSDYTQANPALSQKQLDLNLFQHLLFLANYNVSNNDSLTPVGSTYVVPLSLYSQKHQNVADIPQGGTIAIPNDQTNQGRALLVLQAAGLVRLNGGGNALSTPAEIDAAASKVTVTPVDAAQTVPALPSVDGAIVNNNFALDAKLDPSKALFADDPKSPQAQPYINVIVSRPEDKDNATYKRIAELYKDPRVADLVRAESKGTSVQIDRPAADLAGVLADLTKTVQAAPK